MENEVELPKCKYGAQCYRKNAEHLSQFYHPSDSEETYEERVVRSKRSHAELNQQGAGSQERGKEFSHIPEQKQSSNLNPSATEDSRFEEAEGEWEIDEYDGENAANCEYDEVAQEPSTSSYAHHNSSGRNQTPDAVVLLILVGVPGSGKSTFCSKLMSSGAQPWIRICQDIIANGKRGTKKQCLREAESALLRRRSVVIDRCNIDIKQRQDFLELAARLRVNCHAVVLNLPASLCIQRASHRVAHEGGLNAGNASQIINRVFRSRRLPSLSEGFFRITLCRTDADVEKATEEYRVLDHSKLLGAGLFGPVNKKESRPLQLAGITAIDDRNSPPGTNKEELARTQSVVAAKQQILKDHLPRVGVIGTSQHMSSVDEQQEETNTLAFPSISTADFQFDHYKASTILVESVSEFLLKNPNAGLKLMLVDIGSKSHMLSLVKKKATELNVDSDRFTFFTGDITKIRSSGGPPCNVLANATNWRLKAGGGGVNAAIFKAAGPELEEATRKVATTLLPGSSIVVPLSPSSPLRKEEGVTHVIHVLGPNMNPQRPNCLADDYVEGCKILRNAYASLFENFASLFQTKPMVVDNCKRVDTGSTNQKPKLNAFQVLMQASKRKGEVGDISLKREKGEKVRVIEDSITCSGGDHTESGITQTHGQANLPSEMNSISRESMNGHGPKNLLSRENAEAKVHDIRAGGLQGRDKVERKWDKWTLALYKLALHPDESKLLQVTDAAVVLYDLYPKAKKHVLVLSRKQGLDALEDARQEHIALLEHMHSLGEKWAASFLKEDSSLVFRAGYHSVPSMKQLHLHVVSQDFDSACLKNKKHWNSFTTPFFRDSLDIIDELKTHGRVDNCGERAEKALQELELRCHRCRSIQPNMPRLKAHILACTQPLFNSKHLITVDSVNGV
ncbi:hypothetical protein AXG93_626s1100 [Marchantia polymorpha subsp. ruderalis]|uniref:Macro domain-containing protein n=1 Tax=Marchantia polymorpha subsp. ruderalis TaxID=1480154 RepID=A0A176W1B8_MARPO|nr:hypothetical protein AXG93_626s1100 [Marchantia polymorpha subsp. ruderalis]